MLTDEHPDEPSNERRDHGTTANMARLESLVAEFPEAERVDVAEWGDHPTFRVRGKNFVFSDDGAARLTLKLTKEEAAAVVGSDADASPAGYGLGRHGWVSYDVGDDAPDDRWEEVASWIETSFLLVAPKRLARQVAEQRGVDLP